MTKYEEIFNSSYWRALSATVDGTSFIDAFYKRFLSSSKEIAELFEDTDFERLSAMLVLSLAHVSYVEHTDGANATLKHLANFHRDLGVKPHLYQFWLSSVLETVREYDPEYDEDVGESWRRMMRPGIEFMRSKCSES